MRISTVLCAVFGHRPLTSSGWARGVGYAEVAWSEIDGIGREHLFLKAKCPRCGQTYQICNVHSPKRSIP